MRKKIVSLIAALIFVLQGLPVFAATPAVTILSPEKNSIVASDALILSASSSNTDEVRFYLDNAEVARFEGSGEFEYEFEKTSYGIHTFRVVALARGMALKESSATFSVRDFTETEVTNLNFNDFDGVEITTAGFSGFQANVDTTGTPNGKIGLGSGPDGSASLKLQGAKKNDTNLYLPFVTFSLPSANKDVYTIEHDVLVSDEGMRLSYEIDGVNNVIMDSKVGSFTLESGIWYQLKCEFDFNAKKLSLDVNGDNKLNLDISEHATTGVRVCWASRKSDDGYILIDNFIVNRSVASPVVSKMEYLKDTTWSSFTSEVPLGAEQIKLYFDAPLTPASKDSFCFYQNGEILESKQEFTSDGGLLVTLYDELIPQASCVAEYNSGQFGGAFTAFFSVGDRAIYARKVEFNAGSYKPQYACQLTDDASVTTRLILSNTTDTEQPVLAITVVYKNGAMVSCSANTGTVRANGNATINVPAVSADSQCTIASYVVDCWADRMPIMVAGSLIE